jgi:hypothetical protein
VIFGDQDEFALQVDRFEPPWEALDPEEDSVWAAVTIWVAGSNLTEHRRRGTDRVRDNLHIPLVPLARWCVDARSPLHYEERAQVGDFNSPHEELDRWSMGPPAEDLDEAAWLDRRDNWWARHFTGYATRDLIAPSIGFVRNDDRALISWRIPDLPRPDRTFARPRGAEVVSWRVVSNALDEYVAAVKGWAPSAHSIETARTDDGRALEYYTGLAASELEAFGFLAEAADDPAVDPLAQIVRDLTHRTSTGPAQRSIVSFVRAADQPGGHDWWDMRQKLIPTPGTQFEQEGYDAAQTVRSLLGFDAQPITDVENLARGLDLQIATESPAADADRMVVAGGADGRATTMVLANARTLTAWGRRFEIARALGHLLLDPLRGEAIGAASGPQAMASRRRRSGAFAAEFLLPTAALAEASYGVLDGITEGARFAQLLERFGVGANTAAFHLWNQGFLSSSEIRDDLIASV